MNINSTTVSLKNLFTSNNTTTSSYDLSSSLNKRVVTILCGVDGMHDNLPTRINAFPMVIVEADTKSSKPYATGNNSRRDSDVNYKVVGITHYGAGSGDEMKGRENADLEALQLAANIETIIDNNISVSGTAKWAVNTDSDYSANVNNESKTYNSIVEINIGAKYIE